MAHTVEIQEDEDTGELYFIFPPEVLEELGWIEGTVLEWSQKDDSESWVLTKK